MTFTFEARYQLVQNFQVEAEDFGAAVKEAYDWIEEHDPNVNDDFLAGDLVLILRDWLTGERRNPWITAKDADDKEVDLAEITIDSW